ncbi:swr complex subunit [Coniochaeta pulveracea]|uniref:SWR1-complex protein 5 n=1 Tax=Coniochaeta pulveracea TaxID=177199 RepID=A0A420YJP7_9PEZI|nr:swr complex subunit [Coniochaeta pulveracea]
MPPDPVPDQEDDYVSSEDSDFAPEDAPEREVTPSDDDDQAQGAPTVKRKRQAGDTEAEDAGFENSGDEAIIGKGKKRLKRSKKIDEDEGGEGGLIKTRSQRAQEKVEKQYATAQGPVTIDVDALWQQMLNDTSVPATSTAQDGPPQPNQDGENNSAETSPSKQLRADEGTVTQQKNDAPAMIRIKRTYNFAGEVHTEEKLVSRDSAEAKVYLASLGENVDLDALAVEADDQQPKKKMPRKAFRSRFEPVTDQQSQRSDLNLGLGVRLKAREEAVQKEAKKLNTVEKSRMDWAGYVDKEGIKDELVLAGKSKTSYAARQDFLARSEAVREEEARRARLAGKT